jgi:CubicO group peptidase (beta-lactamase class C family)
LVKARLPTGGFGTMAYIDPLEGLIDILFTRRMMDSPTRRGVYGLLDDGLRRDELKIRQTGG